MAKILVVDDDHDIRVLVTALLQAEGHQPSAAESAVEAVEILKTTQFDILLTDANMPKFSGFDLIRMIRANKQLSALMSNTSIVMLTGRRERKDVEHAMKLDVQDYIIKPIDPLLFVQKINDLLKKMPTPEEGSTEFASLALSSPAKAKFAIEFTGISEAGITAVSISAFPEGARVEFDTDLFEKIGIHEPIMRITSCLPREHNSYELKIGFVGADEKMLAKIRAWVFAHTTMRKQSA